MRLLVMLSVLVLTTGCNDTVSNRPCPRVTEFSPAMQDQARQELQHLGPGSTLSRMMDTLAADRAFNRSVCAANPRLW